MVHVDSIQWLLEVEKRDIAYIVSIFEAYDNLAVVRTVNSEQSIIELIISPDYLEDTRQLVHALSSELHIKQI
jgi:hypothetical protein